MSHKRSALLRSLIADTLNDAAVDAAPVTITGSSLLNSASEESRVKSTLSSNAVPSHTALEPQNVRGQEEESYHNPSHINQGQQDATLTEKTNLVPAIGQKSNYQAPIQHPIEMPSLHVPQRKAAKTPTWQKSNVTLEPEDLAILELSDKIARTYGFRIRKGGNPSLFVRAGLRLLENLLQKDPQAWINRVAATMPNTEDSE